MSRKSERVHCRSDVNTEPTSKELHSFKHSTWLCSRASLSQRTASFILRIQRLRSMMSRPSMFTWEERNTKARTTRLLSAAAAAAAARSLEQITPHLTRTNRLPGLAGTVRTVTVMYERHTHTGLRVSEHTHKHTHTVIKLQHYVLKYVDVFKSSVLVWEYKNYIGLLVTESDSFVV